MADGIQIILCALAIFFVLIITISKKKQSRFSGIIIGLSAVVSGIGGFIIYGLAYAQLGDGIFMGVINTMFATIEMFLMDNRFSEIQDTVLMQRQYMVVLFWCVHFLALYTSSNAILSVLGTPILNVIRLWTGKLKKEIVVIYGVNEDALFLANELASGNKRSIFFVDHDASAAMEGRMNEIGCLFFSSEDANGAGVKFLKTIGVSKRKNITLYALSDDQSDNFGYVLKMKESLEQMEIPPDRTAVTLIENMEMPYGFAIQNSPEGYGFGSVMIVDRAYLVAHVLVNSYPPCDYVQFDTTMAKATDGECFTAVIIGFGKIGQAILKNLVINGQFENCEFKVVVFDPNNETVSGYISQNNKSMMEQYDIVLKAESAQSKGFYQYLEKNAGSIKYITVCTGDENRNNEIAQELQSTLARMNADASVFRCSYEGIIYEHMGRDGKFVHEDTKIYKPECLDIRLADKRAMKLNHMYFGGYSEIADWNRTGFIERMSCRASANFSKAFLKMIGLTEKDVKEGGKWEQLTDTQIENLSRTEHLRWCAFYYANGYRQMPMEMFLQRCKAYTEEKKKHGTSQIKIQKDISERMHICLVGWDELDMLTKRYREITGDMNKDYKLDDTNNVMMLPELLI
nr:hypothetical protein [Lachnospiraceae bacterium]